MIPCVTVTGNGYYQIDYHQNDYFYPSNNTTDRIFLLSVDEANQYFDNDAARSCRGWWWLRTPVENLDKYHYRYHYTVYSVSDRGIISTLYSFNESLGVRPAMWIDLSSL